MEHILLLEIHFNNSPVKELTTFSQLTNIMKNNVLGLNDTIITTIFINSIFLAILLSDNLTLF